MAPRQRTQLGPFWRVIAACAIALVTLGALAPRAAMPAAAATVQTVQKFATTQPVMALTFDAGSDRGYAAQILDIAKAKGVKLTFGMTGTWAAANPDLVQRMVREGHQLINHSWDHPDFTTISSAERASQLDRTADLIRQQTGAEVMPYFRPPFGAYNTSVLNDLATNGYTVNVMWTVDTLGWQGATVPQITQRVLDAAAPGAIVLMHVGAASQDANALGGIIDQLRARGYSFATVKDFIEGRASPEYRYFPETGFWVAHGFLRYWEQFGGLAAFGYPISEEFVANGVTVQYFERARFEWHPGAWPARFDVLLGRLGVESAQHDGLLATAPFQPLSAQSDANCTFFPPTGHRLCFGFRGYWQTHGGLEILGYPISEEFRQNGVTVQYFERARLEYHPENTAPWDIEGGLLGRQLLAPAP